MIEQYWTNLRNEAAMRFTAAMFYNQRSFKNEESLSSGVAWAIKIADELVKQLKERNV